MESMVYLQVHPGTHPEDAELCNDKYTAAIELSNRCREFYKSRLEAANSIKSKWRKDTLALDNDVTAKVPSVQSSSTSVSRLSSSSSLSSCPAVHSEDCSSGRKQKNSIDLAMEKLRTEMACLMEQDLSLMKQLLTLNETIEELKWQRQCRSQSTSSRPFTASSTWSVSDTDMYESEDEEKPRPSLLAPPTATRSGGDRQMADDELKEQNAVILPRLKDTDTHPTDRRVPSCGQADTCVRYNTPPEGATVSQTRGDFRWKKEELVIRHDRDQNSFDSGIHEPSMGFDGPDNLVWTV